MRNFRPSLSLMTEMKPWPAQTGVNEMANISRDRQGKLIKMKNFCEIDNLNSNFEVKPCRIRVMYSKVTLCVTTEIVLDV